MDGFRLVRFGRACVDRSRRSVELKSGKKYNIPDEIVGRVTHIHVRAGRISFFVSLINEETGNIKTKRGTFLSIPFGIKFVEFPDFFKGPNGYHYGEPRWYAVKTC